MQQSIIKHLLMENPIICWNSKVPETMQSRFKAEILKNYNRYQDQKVDVERIEREEIIHRIRFIPFIDSIVTIDVLEYDSFKK